MKTMARTRAVGGSLMVTIPKLVVESESIIEGELIEIDVKKRRISGFGLLKGIGKFTPDDELKAEL